MIEGFSLSSGRRLLLPEGSQKCLLVVNGMGGMAGSDAFSTGPGPSWLQDCILSGRSQPQWHLLSQESGAWVLSSGKKQTWDSDLVLIARGGAGVQLQRGCWGVRGKLGCEQKNETRLREGWRRRERDRWSPSVAELCRGGFVQKLNPPQVCTVLYTIEIIYSSHLLSSDCAKRVLSSLFY